MTLADSITEHLEGWRCIESRRLLHVELGVELYVSESPQKNARRYIFPLR